MRTRVVLHVRVIVYTYSPTYVIVFFFFVRSVNSDGLTPLDVAFLSNNRELVRLLLANGATEGNKSNSELEKK